MPRSASVGQLRLPGAGHAPLMHLPKRHLSERLASEISALNLNTDASAAVNPAMAMADHRPQQLTAVNRQYRPPPMLRVPDAEYSASRLLEPRWLCRYRASLAALHACPPPLPRLQW